MNKKYIIIRDVKRPYILRQEGHGRYYTNDGIELNDSNTIESPVGF